jgi:AraC-like DNA-binding protein
VFDRRVSALVESPLVQVYDVRLRTPRAGYGAADRSGIPQVIAPRRGVFGVERRGDTFVVDAGSVFVVDVDDECRVSHPGIEGDDCTVVVPSADLLDEWPTGHAERLGRLRPRDHFAVFLLSRALSRGVPGQLEAEESALQLLGIMARAFEDRPTPVTRLGPGQRLRIARVCALVASDPAARWDLSTVSRAVGWSPFHLARQFRAATGETLAGYLLRLRLGLALDRLANGETDLARLAVDTGFAHHSHFSTRFRAVFGITPTAARKVLTSARLGSLRPLVEMTG